MQTPDITSRRFGMASTSFQPGSFNEQCPACRYAMVSFSLPTNQIKPHLLLSVNSFPYSNERIRNFVQIPITGAADSFSHGYAVPAPSKRELSDRVTRNKAKPRFCTNSDNRRAMRARYRSTERLTSLCWRSFSSSLQRILRTIHPDRRTSHRVYPSAEAERRQTPPCQSARAERRPF